MNLYSDDQLTSAFQTYLLAEKRVSENTFNAYKNDIEEFLLFLKTVEKSVKTSAVSDLKEYLTHCRAKKLSPRTVCRKISSLKLFFDYVWRAFNIENKAEHLIFPKTDKRIPIYLTSEEIEQLLQSTHQDMSERGKRNRVILYLLYASGMRVSELISLTLDSIHFDTGFIIFKGKGSKERSIPLPEPMMILLRDYCETTYFTFIPAGTLASRRYIFASYSKGKEKPLSRQLIWMLIKKCMRLAGIKKNISPHTLRHSLATHLLKNGANLRSLQLFLGHEHLNTVEFYTHLDTSHLRVVYNKTHPRA
jgi:integrase/recombinase XerD